MSDLFEKHQNCALENQKIVVSNHRPIMLQIKPNDRLALATTIERLINLLDAITPDADLEDTGDDEDYLASVNYLSDIRPLKCDVEADFADDEPSLASPENNAFYMDTNQINWCRGCDNDGEESIGQTERENDISDEEPSLGWISILNQDSEAFFGGETFDPDKEWDIADTPHDDNELDECSRDYPQPSIH